ncbi:BaiN/RdsA family NAD(P)/FAD-dependent oxidoreductase [Pinibacter aurantiacus]|uniref:NAD(P)/FAD-dependent oxidoreductase n=1 Tax=Pinibacter aurantiacus TaxID=2851599 RepID=A0A9E2S9S8_9BACT|nr:NAD(P)/FAD-dependent oxidoreductase [Pinibacter aurantiacus]MBV4358556.1 NAD(P)/FAD-dependent oxidoreductase [Pinibacter aurantiacus]
MKRKRLIVIGGGAAGFFCAINAAMANASLEVIIVEKSSKLLSKVKISGGGRCNVTHACFSISEMTKKYPRGGNFVKKTFHHFFTTDTIEWFKQRGVELKTEEDGRMFPVTDSSQTIIDCLLREANRNKIQVLLNADVKKIETAADEFCLQLADGRNFESDFICIACGGYPKLSMFDWLKDTGHSIISPLPSLFTFNMPGNKITNLMGISVENAVVKIIGSKLSQQGPLLITHWGMSGPAVLKLSAWGAREFAEKKYSFSIVVNWVPEYNENSLREFIQQYRFEKATQKIINKNPFQLPQRLWEYLLEQSEVNVNINWADLPAKEQNKLIKNICAQEHIVNGKTTFKEEFVTAGGIDLSEVDSSTMMSRKVKNLFFAGEIIDVDGITGGFNFQNAWTTGFIAGNAIADVQ